jgi:hypothetical protein
MGVAQAICMSSDLTWEDEEERAVHYGAAARDAEREGDFRLALALYMRAILAITQSAEAKKRQAELTSACTKMLQCD